MHHESLKTKILNLVLNVLTVLMVVLIVATVALQVTIYLNPTVEFNPLPPYKMPEALVIDVPTRGATTIDVAESSTPEIIIQPSETIMPSATSIETFIDGTPLADETPIPPTETPFSGYYAFVLQNDINAIESTLIKPNYGCDWVGVAGQVFDLQGRPVVGVRVWLRGSYDNKMANIYTLTMESSAYGPSGFELTLGEKPLNSTGKLSIQLLDQAGIPISERIYFDTFEDCKKNLILINFKQIR